MDEKLWLEIPKEQHLFVEGNGTIIGNVSFLIYLIRKDTRFKDNSFTGDGLEFHPPVLLDH